MLKLGCHPRRVKFAIDSRNVLEIRAHPPSSPITPFGASPLSGRTTTTALALFRGTGGAVVAGLLLGLSFPPFPVPLPLLAWIALVPLLLGWRRRTEARRAFIDAYVALLVTFAVAFHWPLLHVMPATALLSLPPLLLIPMWIAIPFGVAHMLYLRMGYGLALVAWAAMMILAEFGLRAGPLAFPWMLLGHTQAGIFPVNGLAAYGGVPLLSLLVATSNAAVALGISGSARAAGLTTAILLAGAAAAGVAGIRIGDGAAGVLRIVNADEAAGVVAALNEDVTSARVGRATRVAGIQPAFTPRKWADLADSSRVKSLLDMTRGALQSDPDVDIVVWPETAIPPRPSTRRYLALIQALADSAAVPILAGAITTSMEGSAYRNSAVLAAPDTPLRTYDKINLVPFAERVPFAGVIPFLERFAVPAGGVSGYEPGENRTIFEIPGLRFGVLICFETLFSGAARAYARDEADVLVAITQDGWWGDSFVYRQHLAFNRLRSIETGLPMIQAAVSGVSALIYPDGRITVLAGWMERRAWAVDVPPPAAPPPYVRYGDWVTLLAALVALAVGAYFMWHHRHHR